MPAAVDLLRSLREGRANIDADRMEIVQLAATDPANPYGALLRWPAARDAASSLTRSVGARVVLANGALVAYLRRGNPSIQVFLPEEEPQRSNIAKALAMFFVEHVHTPSEEPAPRTGGILISTINGLAVVEHWMAHFLLDAGFSAGAMGFNVRRGLPPVPGPRTEFRANA